MAAVKAQVLPIWTTPAVIATVKIDLICSKIHACNANILTSLSVLRIISVYERTIGLIGKILIKIMTIENKIDFITPNCQTPCVYLICKTTTYSQQGHNNDNRRFE